MTIVVLSFSVLTFELDAVLKLKWRCVGALASA